MMGTGKDFWSFFLRRDFFFLAQKRIAFFSSIGFFLFLGGMNAFSKLNAQGFLRSGETPSLSLPNYYSLTVSEVIASITESRAPFFLEGYVFFSYAPVGLYDPLKTSVRILFEHENYLIAHPFFLNKNNILIFAYRLEEKHMISNSSLAYRFLVNGLAIVDPKNPAFKEDQNGTRISVFSLRSLPRSLLFQMYENPVALGEGRYRFYFFSQTPVQVFIVGSFNAWNSSIHPLEVDLIDPQVYFIDLDLFEFSEIFYYFSVAGEVVLDRLNREQASVNLYSREPSLGKNIVSYKNLSLLPIREKRNTRKN